MVLAYCTAVTGMFLQCQGKCRGRARSTMLGTKEGTHQRGAVRSATRHCRPSQLSRGGDTNATAAVIQQAAQRGLDLSRGEPLTSSS